MIHATLGKQIQIMTHITVDERYNTVYIASYPITIKDITFNKVGDDVRKIPYGNDSITMNAFIDYFIKDTAQVCQVTRLTK